MKLTIRSKGSERIIDVKDAHGELSGKRVAFSYMKTVGKGKSVEVSERRGVVDRVSAVVVTIRDETRQDDYRSFRLDGIKGFTITVL